MERRQKKYDPTIELLYKTRKEHLLPVEFRRTIPQNTKTNWRYDEDQHHYGAQYRHYVEESFGMADLKLRNKQLEKALRTITKSWLKVSDVVMPVLRERANEKLLIEEILRLLSVMPRKMTLKAMRMPEGTYKDRLLKYRKPCEIPPDHLCAKRYPKQITPQEIKKIKELMEDEHYVAWPVGSVYFHAFRNGEIFMSHRTFTKYVKKLSLQRNFPKPPRKEVGIIALKPNEFIHVDTTHIDLPSGEKASAVFVTDNYSKCILGWSVSKDKSAQNVIRALRMSIGTINKFHPNLICATVVADAGKENHAIKVNEYLKSTNIPEITKIIARKDIKFSNNPAEALNKIMKRYIRAKQPQTYKQLEALLSDSVKDYCFVRPHNSLDGITPMELYTNNIPLLCYEEEVAMATQRRMGYNRGRGCGKC